MRFIVIYPNSAREIIFSQLILLAKKMDLSSKPIQANNFNVVTAWPSQEQLNEMNLGIQVEELILENDQFTSVRKLIIDVEMVKPEIANV